MVHTWDELARLFERARELGSEERVAFLDEACAGRVELRARLVRMLAQGDEEPGLLDLESGAMGMVPTTEGRGLTPSFFGPSEVCEGRPRVPAADLPGGRAGEVLGDYQLVRRLGQGGMAHVWEAEQLSLSRRVALKLVRPEILGLRTLEMFEREARAGGRLAHPGIVRIHAHGENEGVHWIAMELVEGAWTLRDFIDEVPPEGKLPDGYYPRVAGLVAEIADALAAAHEAGVIHRDVKPRNILIGPDDRPRVADFGLARIADEASLSQTGDLAGTYCYMSPEQVAGRRVGLDHRTDVFSLGVVLYELLTLTRPFGGDTSQQVAAQILTQEPDDPRSIRSQIPAELAVITGKCLEKDPGRRYGSMAELAADLRRHLAHEPIEAQPPGALARGWKWARRNPTRSVAGGVAATAFAVISALLAVNMHQAGRLEGANLELKQSRDASDLKSNAILGLSAFRDLADLEERTRSFGSLHPDQLQAMRTWMVDAQELVGTLSGGEGGYPGHRAMLSELESRALPSTEEQRVRDREGHPRIGELAALRAELAWLEQSGRVRRGEAQPEPWPLDAADRDLETSGLVALAWSLVDPDRGAFGGEARGLALARHALERGDAADPRAAGRTAAWALLASGLDGEAVEVLDRALASAPLDQEELGVAELGELREAIVAARSEAPLRDARAALAELESVLDERATWSFADDRDLWWHAQLVELIASIEAFGDDSTGLVGHGMVGAHGWGIGRRIGEAERLRVDLTPGGRHRERWMEALRAIADHPEYGGLNLALQVGLVPLAPDPESRLWEFWHVLSGDEPQRGGDGRLVIREETGAVFVLLLGGSFWMGASADPATPHNRDPDARPNEGPVHAVELSPFFISKYEMTQGQWLRLSGENPSFWPPGRRTWDRVGDLRHPVENVTWADSVNVLQRFGMWLPSEAQWEFAARAGTEWVWWTGSDKESLDGAANLADRSARILGAPASWSIEGWLEDGYRVHAPVGSYRPNGFGLHDVAGNVYELCRDGFDPRFYADSPGVDPVSAWEGVRDRVQRGGAFRSDVYGSRSAHRLYGSQSQAFARTGLRPTWVPAQ